MPELQPASFFTNHLTDELDKHPTDDMGQSGYTPRWFNIAFAFCLFFTVAHLLVGDHDKLMWLIASDINVGIWLFVAWAFDGRRR